MMNREVKNVDDIAIELLGASFRYTVGVSARMQLTCKERLIRIDVPYAANKGLIEQQSLDRRSMLFKARVELWKTDRQRVGPNFFDQFWQCVEIFEAPELADIVVQQHSRIQINFGAGIGRSLAVPEQLARHAEMNVESATIEIEKNLFAPTSNLLNYTILQRMRCFEETAASHSLREQRSMLNGFAGYQRRYGAHNCLDLGKLRHNYGTST